VRADTEQKKHNSGFVIIRLAYSGMARQKQPPTVAPSLPADRAVPILENLIAQADAVLKDTTGAMRQQWVPTAKGALIAALGNQHSNVEAFVSAEQGGIYLMGMTDADIRAQNDDLLRQMTAVLKSTVEQLRWQLPDPTQVFLPAGSSHDAYIGIRKIIQLATTEILIVDTYVDETLWQLLTNVPPTTKIRVMTMQMKGDFTLEGRKFATQHGNTIEVRQTKAYHDRFIIVDSGRVWHLGASIKDAGHKAFGMSEFVSPVISGGVKSDVENTWSAAALIPL
jgi:hypothetical protein